MENKKIIKIKCDGTQYVDFHELNEFQEDIKTITREDLDLLKASIKNKGILMPGFVWKYKNKWWILDMHQRLKAFIELEKEGWKISPVPVVEIFAKTKKEAKAAVLVFISQHGKVDEDKLKIYLKKYDIKLQNIVIRTDPIKIKLSNNVTQNKSSLEYTDVIELVIKIETEEEQKILYEEMSKRGYKCRVLRY